ncbi:MAG: 16S rRNA (guanine(527)-N(7))-methyltransferase RsmG [Bacteroidia bacterium]|nr:MAG: 16S rRNA (guanine(527)-N(7))-methyltransferase RsmG [Bacteroidia bacterium]
MTDILLRYFPDLTETQIDRFSRLKDIYKSWNSRINVISRKDFDNFCIHHVLHSLAIAKIINFTGGTRILDAGTGGGFPGVPLAIMFPDAEFFLLDSIEKKIKVVSSVAAELKLTNVKAIRKRIEEEAGTYDFVVSRAVTAFPEFVKLTRKNVGRGNRNELSNGIIYLKGGDLSAEMGPFMEKIVIRNIADFFSETYFETKKIVYLTF